MRNTSLLLFVFILAVLSAIGIGPQQGKDDKYAESVETARKARDEQLPIVDLNAPKPTQAAERARRQAKDRRHNLGKPPISEGMTLMSRNYHWPADFPALPVEQSTTIVVGQVSEAKAHLSDDKSGVYSEVVLKVDEVLKDEAGITSTVVAEREGGRVRFPSGSIYRYFVDGMGIPKVGHCYLLFLTQLEDGDFSIVTGYELRGGHVVPLDESGVVQFEKYKNFDEHKFLTEVRELIKSS